MDQVESDEDLLLAIRQTPDRMRLPDFLEERGSHFEVDGTTGGCWRVEDRGSGRSRETSEGNLLLPC